MGIVIRQANYEDEAAVVTLWRSANLTVPYNDPNADFRFALSCSNSDVLVAIDQSGAIIGSAMVGHDGHRGWVYYVASSPDRRGTGIGRKVMAAAELWLKERNISKVQLLVRETNTQVRSFYESVGYEHTPRVVMAKWLNTHDE